MEDFADLEDFDTDLVPSPRPLGIATAFGCLGCLGVTGAVLVGAWFLIYWACRVLWNIIKPHIY